MQRFSTDVLCTCLVCGKHFYAARYNVEKRGGGKFCSRRCFGDNRPKAELFWRKVNKTDTCWLWTAGAFDDGYGCFHVHGHRLERAHRFSWELTHGPIPGGQQILHHCDTPLCVRPDHLFIGTHLENKADEVAKGRTAKGENNGNAKITDADVRQIRERYKRGGISAARLGALYGLGETSTLYIIQKRTWKHVIDPSEPI